MIFTKNGFLEKTQQFPNQKEATNGNPIPKHLVIREKTAFTSCRLNHPKGPQFLQKVGIYSTIGNVLLHINT